MWPITTVWHTGDVVLGVMGVKEKPTLFGMARLMFAVIGLAGNIYMEKDVLTKDVIEVGGVKWKRLD